MASRAALRWWPWGIGKPPRSRVTRKWISEEAPEVFPLMLAVGTGLTMGVGTIAYQLLYNPSIMCVFLALRRVASRARARGFWVVFARHGVGAWRVCWVVPVRARGRRVCVWLCARGSGARVGARASTHTLAAALTHPPRIVGIRRRRAAFFPF
jgi:hypothetical protein